MGEQKQNKKSIISTTLRYLVIAAAAAAVLIVFSYYTVQIRSISHESAGLINNFEETYKYMMGKESATADDIKEDLSASARLTASAVRAGSDTLQTGKYGDGWIVKKKGSGVVTPDGYPENIDLSDKVLPEEYATIVIDDVMASCAKIRGSYYYVEFEEAREEDKLIDKGVNYQKALDNIASATGYDYISLVSSDTAGSADKDDYRITAATGRFCGFDTSSELGLNDFLSTVSAAGPDAEGADAVSSKLMKIKGKYYAVFGTKTFDVNYMPDDAAVMLVPLRGIILRAFAFTMVMLILLLLLCLPMAVWLISIFRRYSGGYFTKEQKESYSYEAVKRKAVIITGLCTIIAFIGAGFTVSLDCVFQQTSCGTSTLREYFRRIDDDKERTDIQWESSQDRYIRNAGKLASLIDSNRDLQNEKWLEEASGIIDADYIMIFDEDGDEIISDSQYKRISLKNRTNPDMADFSRLLNGVESISRPGVEDEVTGLTRDYHGICLRYIIDEKDAYGALLIAVDPKEHTWVSFGNTDFAASTMAPEDGFIIGVDPKTGVITDGGSSTLKGSRLKESEIQDSYLGFVTIGGRLFFGVSSEHNDRYYYYGIDEDRAMLYVLPSAVCYALLVLLVMGLLCRMLLGRSPYRSKEAEIINSYTKKKLDRLSAFIMNASEKNDRLLSLKSDRLNAELTKDYYYSNVTPEREALSTFELLMFIFTLSTGAVVLARNMSSDSGQTVIDFLLSGRWPHGFNIFSLAAIFLLFCILFVVLALLKLISVVMSQVLSKKGRTICSLTMNLLFYAALIAFIFISLGCLGVNAKTLLASAGIVGLAVSISLKDILSDMIAGIMLITGRVFEVGDYIEIKDASAGTVKSMGLIKTELISDDGVTFSIRNSMINKVTNHSRISENKTDI